MMRSLIWIVLAASAADPQPAVSSVIYRCAGAAGEVLFSDLPCAGGRVQATQPTTTIDMAVSQDERATLDRLSRAATHRNEQPRHASAQPRTAIQSERRCAGAQAGLDRIHAKKRSGYRASSAATLDARERDYRARRDRDCSGHPR